MSFDGSYPPPTRNSLPQSQRTRLIRSTRKLGAVLGTTPHLLEPCQVPLQIPLHAHARSRSDSAATRRTSEESLASTSASSVSLTTAHKQPTLRHTTPLDRSVSLSGHKSRPLKPAPLFVRLTPTSPPVPESVADSEHESETSDYEDDDDHDEDSPASPSLLTPKSITPPSPFHPNSTAKALRLRKMAKLTRHLGESVPPELVFPSSPKSKRLPPIPMPHVSMTTVQRTDPTPKHPIPSSPRRLRRIESSRRLNALGDHRRSRHAHTHAHDPHRLSSPGVNPRRLSVGRYTHANGHASAQEQRPPSWEGEWNLAIGEVQVALRNLRT